MTIFEAVKTTVAPRMAAEHFGLSVSRNGMVCCPFHNDRHPSMKLYEDHYYRRDSVDRKGNKNSKWVCSGKINNGKDSCDSIPIYEKELIPLLFEVFRDTKEASAAMLEEYERMYRAMTSDSNIEKKIESTQATIELTLKKKSKLLELVALDSITPADFKSMTAQCNADIKAAEQELAELREQQESSEEFRSNMERIRKVLRDAERDCQNGEITKEFIDTFIDKIFATPEGDGTMRLDIKIFTGESCEKYLQKLKRRANFEGCTGHTFKKMILVRTANYIRKDRTAAGHEIEVRYIATITV